MTGTWPTAAEYEQFRAISGPCAGCGATSYGLSTGGPAICPACDCLPPERRVRQLADENRWLREVIASLPGGPDALMRAAADELSRLGAEIQGE